MKVLLTGSSGFLGKIILAHLTDDEVFTIGRSCPHNSVDLTKSIPDLPYCQLVIHAAGKAHLVPKTNIQKSEFFKVNVLGTENLLKGLDKLPKMPQAFVFISSVAVYGKSIGDMIDERTPLEATDAYGLRKRMLNARYCDCHFWQAQIHLEI
jgi:nucleoside-diphosphate-sugar epimerase